MRKWTKGNTTWTETADGKLITESGGKQTIQAIARNTPPCAHLGPAIERDGITVKVKCGCSGKEQDRPHAAHECDLHGRCLPTLVPVDNEKWLERDESKLYRCCQLCPDNPRNQ